MVELQRASDAVESTGEFLWRCGSDMSCNDVACFLCSNHYFKNNA